MSCRWSFHTSVSSQSLATEKDHQQSKKLKALQPICSPNKRRKSCAPDLHQDSHIHAGSSSSLSRPLVADIGKKTVYEQSRISRHYLLATQQQSNSQRLHRRFSTGGMVAVSRERESDSAKLKRRQHQRYLDEYFSHVQQADKYELAYHEHFRIRRSKTNKEIPPPPDYFANVPDEIVSQSLKSKYPPKNKNSQDIIKKATLIFYIVYCSFYEYSNIYQNRPWQVQQTQVSVFLM